MEDLKRVFIHELGHFIANEINQRYYSGTGTKTIALDMAIPSLGLFVGDTKINLSQDEKERKAAPREFLPQALGATSYGCFFQAYYKGESLKTCIGLNGMDDVDKWHGNLWANKIGDFNAEVGAVEDEYFELLKNKNALDKMMQLDPKAYLIKSGPDNYIVDIEKLRNDTSEFIDEHHEHYQILIEKYRKVIDESIG